jgi:hypothetical protein
MEAMDYSLTLPGYSPIMQVEVAVEVEPHRPVHRVDWAVEEMLDAPQMELMVLWVEVAVEE